MVGLARSGPYSTYVLRWKHRAGKAEPNGICNTEGTEEDTESTESGRRSPCRGDRTPRALGLELQIEGGLEAVVDGYLIAGDEFIGFVGHADHLLEFLEHFRSHAFAEGRSSVRDDAVVAIIGDTDGDVEKFFRERVEGAGSHDGFKAFPGALQEHWVVGDGFPEIVDVVGFARGHDVIIDGFDGGAGVFVFDEAESGHENRSVKKELHKEC